MKKILFLFIMLFSFTYLLDAECTYKDVKELNSLSIYIEYAYSYKGNNTFDVTLYNISEELSIKYDNNYYDTIDNKTTIYNISEGSTLKVYVDGTYKSNCPLTELRVINIRVPYVNPYYNSSECLNRTDLSVCTNEFLDYKISESAFNSLINKKNDITIDVVDDDVIEEDSFIDKVFIFIKKVYIPVILVLLSTIVTYSIFSSLYRKIKHGI